MDSANSEQSAEMGSTATKGRKAGDPDSMAGAEDTEEKNKDVS
jgi:hypothetical protein